MLKGLLDTLEYVRNVEELNQMRVLRDVERSSISWGIQQICSMYEEGRFDFDVEFQRPDGRWSTAKQCMLIDSIVRGYPIPPIYTKKANDGTYIVLDGKQRLITTIFRFCNNEFHLVGLDPVPFEVLDKDKKPTGEVKLYDICGKLFKELPVKVQKVINDYRLTICYLESGNGTELSNDTIRSAFKRLNNGVALSRKEMNIANCTDLTEFTALGQHELFQNTLSVKAKESRNQISILMKMYMMLHEDLENVSFGPDSMTEAMEDNITTEEDRQELTQILDKMLAVYDLFGGEDKAAKAIRKRWTTETHLVSLTPWFKKAIEEDIPDDMMMEFLSEAYATKMPISAAYTEFSRSGSGKTHAIIGRDAEIARFWDDFFSEGETVDVTDDVEDEDEVEVVNVDESESEMVLTEHRYGMRNRPAAPGAQPDGFLNFEDDETGRYHNILVYERELTDEEVEQYELDRL